MQNIFQNSLIVAIMLYTEFEKGAGYIVRTLTSLES